MISVDEAERSQTKPDEADDNMAEMEGRPWSFGWVPEPRKAWDLMIRYCQMGYGRSMRALASRADVSRSTLDRYSRLYSWDRRRAAWDEEAGHRRAAQVEASRRRQIRLETIATENLLGAAALWARRMLSKAKDAREDDPLFTVKITDLLAVLDAAGNAARLARGEPTQRIGVESKEASVDQLLKRINDLSPDKTPIVAFEPDAENEKVHEGDVGGQ